MLKTIKLKIILLTVAVLFALSATLSFFVYVNFKKDTHLIVEGCNSSITNFAEQINKDIENFENNAIDLAILGEVYYKTGKSDIVSRYLTTRIFQHYKKSLGGGIWFEPFVINPTKRLSCTYAFKKEDGDIVIDENFETESYNYLEQSWYKEIAPQLSKHVMTGWSRPYFEKEGSSSLMTTVGAGIYDNDKLIGISTVDWQVSSIFDTVSKMKPTPNSFALFADINNDYILVSTDKHFKNESLLGESLKKIPWYSPNAQNGNKLIYDGIEYVSYIKTLDNGMILIINVPEYELFMTYNKYLFIMLTILSLASLLIVFGLYFVLKRNINTPIKKLTNFATKIGQGELDAEVKLSEPKEFAELATTFNKMTKDIREYITNINQVNKEKEKMQSELSIAKKIQYSVLPQDFYTDIKEFNIYASMEVAKGVGGDFYDCFFINPEHFMFLVADVSGKGIPAALFMMTTKTLIKNLASEGYSPKELIEKINKQVCENNKEGYFVTMFAGICNIKTGKMYYVNCGHNPPLIKKGDKPFEYLNIEANLVIGIMNNVEYNIVETEFNKNDTIFLYTDGITEALDNEEKLYGEERLLSCINECKGMSPEVILQQVKNDVEKYSDGVEQSDDMTMLCFKYNGLDATIPEVRYFHSEALLENYSVFKLWIESTGKEFSLNDSIINKLQLVTEEIYVNIASYAYTKSPKPLEVYFKKCDNEITLKFVDSGIYYNPLEKPDPDITLDTNERAIGGLGIYMVKNSVDYMGYNYTDKKNVLVLKIVV